MDAARRVATLESEMTEYDRYVMFCKREGFTEIMGRVEFNELMA